MRTRRPTPAPRRRGALLAAALAVLLAGAAGVPAVAAEGADELAGAGRAADSGTTGPGTTAPEPGPESEPEPEPGPESEPGAAAPEPETSTREPGAPEVGPPGVDPDAADAAGRQWMDRPTRVELDEDARNATIEALHCRAQNQGQGDRVVLRRWVATGWTDVAEQFLDSSRMCETVEWTIRDVARGLGGWFAMATLQGPTTQVDWFQFQLVVRLKPPVITHPTGGTVGVGGRLTLTSTGSYGTEWPFTDPQWQSSPDGRTWTPIEGAIGPVHQTPPATPELDGMQYRAVHHRVRMDVHESGGEAVSDVAVLRVRQAPTIDPEPADAQVPLGETAVFETAAVGAPVPTVQWETAPPGEAFAPIPGATTGRLEVPDVRAEMDGTRYRAVFTNTLGVRTTREAVLTVLLPPVIHEHPQSVRALRGQRVTFTVVADRVDTWRWQWQYPGSTDDDRWVTHSSAWGSTFSPTAGPLNNGQRYRAMVTGPGGTRYSEVAVLTMVEPPPVHLSVAARTQVVPALPGW